MAKQRKDSHLIAESCAECIDDKKGYNILVLDISSISDISDFFIIATVDTDIQMRAVANHIEAELADRGLKIYKKEGLQSCNWAILDYVDAVVHLFLPDVRERYALEEMWADAKKYEWAEDSLKLVETEDDN
jgi:ribosome-associated protein